MNRSLAALTCLLCALPADGQSLNFEDPIILGTINTGALIEASGIAASHTNSSVFWTHNDGSRNHLFAFATDGALLADFTFSGNPRDVEAIATGPGPDATRHYIYLGDIGSNSATRDTVTIFRVLEPAIDPAWILNPISQNIQAESIHLKYPDGTFDAEALFIDPIGQILFVATKQNNTCRLYSIPLGQLIPNQTHDLQFAVAVSFDQVSAGDISPDGRIIALRRENRAMAWNRNLGETIAQALSRSGQRIPVVGTSEEPNGEAISFLPDNSGYITLSEGEFQPIYFFRNANPPCHDAPRFTLPPEKTDSGLLLTFTACVGSTVAVERSENLQDWTELTTVPVTTSAASYTDTTFASLSYYRLRRSGP